MANAATARAFQYGLGIFALTALIGLANAIKIFGTIDQNTLLTHLHSGTLGWITMGVFGMALVLFSRDGATVGPNVLLTAFATAAYVLAFWSGNFYARAVFGVVMLATIFGWWAWVVYRASLQGYARLSIPQLSIVLGLTTLVIGSTLGVIVQILYATNNLNEQNAVLIGAHASAQVAGYLVLVAAGLAEWTLNPNGARTRAGAIQTWLLFLAGLPGARVVGRRCQLVGAQHGGGRLHRGVDFRRHERGGGALLAPGRVPRADHGPVRAPRDRHLPAAAGERSPDDGGARRGIA